VKGEEIQFPRGCFGAALRIIRKFDAVVAGTGLALSAGMGISMNVSVLLVVLLTSGCAFMPPVRLEGTPADLEMLSGQWNGEYTSPALGRRGSIEFKLVAGQNQASGSVLMIPQASGRPYERGSLEHPPESSGGQPSSQLLTIRFVRASAGTISGMLDPYWDPDRNCEARTVFNGNLIERTIEGTFTTTFDCGAGEASGRWHVTRKSTSK
jgi:hypothetical protein